MEQAAPAEVVDSPVQRARMTGYASGNFGKNVLASTMDVFLLFVLTERWGVSPAAAGLVVMIGLVWDGLCDPLLGRLVDRSADRLGLYRRLLFVGAPLVGVFFTLFFLDPGWRGPAILGWATVMVLLFRTAYSVCDVAHNALMMRMTRAPGAATTLSGLRYMFSCLGALTVAHFARAFVDPAVDGGGYGLLAVTGGAALAYVATLWLSAASAPRSVVVPGASAPRASLAWILGNRPLLLLLALGFVQALTLPFFARSFAYIGKGIFHDPGWIGKALTTLALSQLVALPGWMSIARRIRQAHMLALALITTATGLTLFAAVPAAIAGIALFGIGNAGLQMMIWVLLANAIDHGECQTGVRFEGLPVALLLLVLKLGGGLSGALLGQGLSWIGWPVATPLAFENGANLLTMAWAVPLIGALVCLVIFTRQVRKATSAI
ncbi:MFS transporter [Sphingomonas albertensis]|uniref:MFS transporter n=1 Tax=Sphingomonas albertensis TaxID=2762591 RepID=A0ABR7AL61_9SPHN|nr:MFS transporter [Sphingomonas albertensis]MBC3941199.1 MFS transporter [Sphingomonas albertensis]